MVCVRETQHLTPIAILSRCDSAVRALSFSHADTPLIAVGAEDGLVEISVIGSSPASNARVWSVQHNNAETNSVAFHPTQPLLAYATDSKDKCVVHLFGVQ